MRSAPEHDPQVMASRIGAKLGLITITPLIAPQPRSTPGIGRAYCKSEKWSNWHLVQDTCFNKRQSDKP